MGKMKQSSKKKTAITNSGSGSGNNTKNGHTQTKSSKKHKSKNKAITTTKTAATATVTTTSSSVSSFPSSLLSQHKPKNKSNGNSKSYNYNSSSSYHHSNNNNNYNTLPITPTTTISTLIPSAVFTSSNFFTKEECQAWIQHAETNISFEYMNSPQTREYAQRECGRIQIHDWEMAERLYERMKSMVDFIMTTQPPLVGDMFAPSLSSSTTTTTTTSSSDYRHVGCNGNLRMYKYEKGMLFGRHYDGSNRIDRYEGGGNTEITVLVYLSSCEGGATRFYLPFENNGKNRMNMMTKTKKNKGHVMTKKGKKASSTTSNNQHENFVNDHDDVRNGIAFVPQEGTILMHMHGDRCLEHEADPVLSGVKYVLRTDIVFAKSDKVLK